MGAITTNDPCTVCFRKEAIMHSHHTIPRSRGGDDSLQIILCPTDHNSLHANAVFLISKIKNPAKKREAKQFWRTADDEERALPYLQILVQALLAPIPEGVTRQHLLSTSVETPTFESLKMLQTELGLSSMQKALDYCIALTLAQKGINNENRKASNAKQNEWFLK